MTQPTIFADSGLPAGLVDNLRRFNPWWESEAMPAQPPDAGGIWWRQMRRRLDTPISHRLSSFEDHGKSARPRRSFSSFKTCLRRAWTRDESSASSSTISAP